MMQIDVREFVQHVLRRAFEKAYSEGPSSLCDVTVDDILLLADFAGVRLRRPKVVAVLKRLHSDGRITRCMCPSGLHWRHLPPDALIAASRGNA